MTLIPLLDGCDSSTFCTSVQRVSLLPPLRTRRRNSKAHLRLEIAVDDTVVTHEDQAREELVREAPDQRRREADELVRLDELVEVDGEKLGGDAEVIAEVEGLDHADNVVLLVRVLSE